MCALVTLDCLGDISGVLDAPDRTVYLSAQLDVDERQSVASALLVAAGAPSGDDVTCLCGLPLDLGTWPEAAAMAT